MSATKPATATIPFATSGLKNTIPNTATGGAASYTNGFPSVTMLPIPSGGIPPDGKDFNGILYALSAAIVWMNSGGLWKFDSAVVTQLGGYAQGQVLQSNDGLSAYVSLVNNNTTDFNTTPSSIGTLWKAWSGDAKADTLSKGGIFYMGQI